MNGIRKGPGLFFFVANLNFFLGNPTAQTPTMDPMDPFLPCEFRSRETPRSYSTPEHLATDFGGCAPIPGWGNPWESIWVSMPFGFFFVEGFLFKNLTCIYPPGSTNIAIAGKIHHESVDVFPISRWGIFQPAVFVYRRVVGMSKPSSWKTSDIFVFEVHNLDTLGGWEI